MLKTTLEDWEWDEAPMQAVTDGFEEYMSELWTALHADEDVDTVSGYGFDGCDTCETRETLAYLMPRLLDMYVNRQIRMQHDDRPVD